MISEDCLPAAGSSVHSRRDVDCKDLRIAIGSARENPINIQSALK